MDGKSVSARNAFAALVLMLCPAVAMAQDVPPRPVAFDAADPTGRSALPPYDADAAIRPAMAQGADAMPTAEAIGKTLTSGVAIPSARAKSESTSPGGSRIRPLVELEQRLPRQLRAGQATNIEFILHNRGDLAATEISLINEVPQGVVVLESNPPGKLTDHTLEWTITRLEPGQEKRVELKVKATHGEGRFLTASRTRLRYETEVITEMTILQPRLELTVEGPEKGSVGDEMPFEVTVKNTGNIAAEGVILRDVLPATLAHPYGPELENVLGRIEAGEERSTTLSVTPTEAGEIANTFAVHADELAPVEKSVKLHIRKTKLSLSANGPRFRYLNRPCTFQFTIRNEGARAAEEVELKVDVPKGISFEKASNGGQVDDKKEVVHWKLGNIDAGETTTLSLTGVPTAMGDQQCQAVLRAFGETYAKTELATKVRGTSRLAIHIDDLDDPIESGKETIYEVRLLNEGTLPATNVRVSMTMSPELKAVAADGPSNNKAYQNILAFEPVPQLEPTGELVYRIKVVAQRKGDARLRVSAQTDEMSRPIISEEPTKIYSDF
ncbi:Large cysteine-rich periplasmic protein omcB precursor [Planctomycetes bacterium Pan216]|uniref:Large cysteine-rich periplasmic protein omcB n=2 Tax=Kolteria novifilia TaxID=2527975 RepID=A0A518BCD6_9BACT|nr:Large cysteine-rich periplasmic protein omcB precursor [Planctomycetes bacterium Pan216]